MFDLFFLFVKVDEDPISQSKCVKCLFKHGKSNLYNYLRNEFEITI